MYMEVNASPELIQSGEVVEIRVRAFNNNLNFPPIEFRDVYPRALRILRESGFLDFQLLSGPSNPITGGPINVGASEATSFTWRYRVTGSGCFRVRGQVSATTSRLSRFVFPFTSNNGESELVCVTPPPRAGVP
jgi:hypothetical protein